MLAASVSPAKRPPGRNRSAMYSATTRSIKVVVKPFFLEDQSSPPEDHYVWAYHVRIENHGAETVQLRRRHWRITDAMGRMQEVKGAGVVGEQPILKPGEAFTTVAGEVHNVRNASSSAPATAMAFYVAKKGARLEDLSVPAK